MITWKVVHVKRRRLKTLLRQFWRNDIQTVDKKSLLSTWVVFNIYCKFFSSVFLVLRQVLNIFWHFLHPLSWKQPIMRYVVSVGVLSTVVFKIFNHFHGWSSIIHGCSMDYFSWSITWCMDENIWPNKVGMHAFLNLGHVNRRSDGILQPHEFYCDELREFEETQWRHFETKLPQNSSDVQRNGSHHLLPSSSFKFTWGSC